MRTVQWAVACVAVLVATAGQVQAGLITFTNRAAWESAVGSFTTERFNSITADTYFQGTSLSFPDLTLLHLGNGTALVDAQPYESNPGLADIDGTPRVNLNGIGQSATVSILFNSPVSAVGFDTVNYDVDNDFVQAYVGSTLVGNFPPFRDQAGFLGVLETSGNLITRIDITTPFANTYNAFDNVSFGTSQISTVPEPSSIAVFGIGACVAGVGVARRRRREKQVMATA